MILLDHIGFALLQKFESKPVSRSRFTPIRQCVASQNSGMCEDTLALAERFIALVIVSDPCSRGSARLLVSEHGRRRVTV